MIFTTNIALRFVMIMCVVAMMTACNSDRVTPAKAIVQSYFDKQYGSQAAKVISCESVNVELTGESILYSCRIRTSLGKIGKVQIERHKRTKSVAVCFTLDREIHEVVPIRLKKTGAAEPCGPIPRIDINE
jgi:hypothetical protein